MNLEAASWNLPQSQTPGLNVLSFTFVTAVCQPWRNSGRFFSFASVSKYFRMFFKEKRGKKQHYSPSKEQERDTDCLVGVLLTTRTNFRWALGAELTSRGKEINSGGYCAFCHQGSFSLSRGALTPLSHTVHCSPSYQTSCGTQAQGQSTPRHPEKNRAAWHVFFPGLLADTKALTLNTTAFSCWSLNTKCSSSAANQQSSRESFSDTQEKK